jgi:hypothetical protein
MFVFRNGDTPSPWEKKQMERTKRGKKKLSTNKSCKEHDNSFVVRFFAKQSVANKFLKNRVVRSEFFEVNNLTFAWWCAALVRGDNETLKRAPRSTAR